LPESASEPNAGYAGEDEERYRKGPRRGDHADAEGDYLGIAVWPKKRRLGTRSRGTEERPSFVPAASGEIAHGVTRPETANAELKKRDMKRAAPIALTALSEPLAFIALCGILAFTVAAGAEAAVLTSVPATASSPAVAVYVARPRDAGKHPAVLLLHGCDGINGFVIVSADRLAARGYVAVALDALGPSEPDGACTDRDGTEKATTAARATLAWLRSQEYVDADHLGVIGFSMGAAAALNLIDPFGSAAPPPAGLRVAVAFYPSCDGRDGNLTVPLAIFDGDADKITPAAPCAALVQAATAKNRAAQITTYPGATHGFQVPGPDRTFFGEPIRFDPLAAADSAQKTEQFLTRYLKP
jgi:dienelactone hydrolase